MRTLGLLVLLLAAAPAPGRAAVKTDRILLQDPVLAMRVDGNIEIDTTGAVSSFTPTTKVAEPFASRLRAMAKQLRFEPVLVDGRPRAATTLIRLRLKATPQGADAFGVAIEDVSFPHTSHSEHEYGEGETKVAVVKAVRRPAPRYPASSLYAGVMGRVLVAVRMDESGQVIDASVRQTALFNVKGTTKELAPYVADLEQASLHAIRRWKFDIKLVPGAAPSAENLSGLVPVVYMIQGADPTKHGVWTWEARTVTQPVPWLAPAVAEQLPGVNDVDDAGTFGLAPSRFRLVSGTGAL